MFKPSTDFCQTSECFIQWAYDWQTLITGVAAAFTVYLLWKQIHVADRHEKARIERKARAFRATLPVVLSNICQYADDSLKYWKKWHDYRDWTLKGSTQSDGFATILTPPVPIIKLPPDIVSYLQEFIESSLRHDVNLRLEDILRRLQIMDSRIVSSIDPEPIGIVYIGSQIMDSAELYAISSSLFSFARSEDDEDLIKVDVEDVYKALKLNYIHKESHPIIWERIERRFEKR